MITTLIFVLSLGLPNSKVPFPHDYDGTYPNMSINVSIGFLNLKTPFPSSFIRGGFIIWLIHLGSNKNGNYLLKLPIFMIRKTALPPTSIFLTNRDKLGFQNPTNLQIFIWQHFFKELPTRNQSNYIPIKYISVSRSQNKTESTLIFPISNLQNDLVQQMKNSNWSTLANSPSTIGLIMSSPPLLSTAP